MYRFTQFHIRLLVLLLVHNRLWTPVIARVLEHIAIAINVCMSTPCNRIKQVIIRIRLYKVGNPIIHLAFGDGLYNP